MRNGLPRAVQLAPADVTQPPTDREIGLDVDDQQVLLEARRPGDDFARIVEHHRVTVEDELVLAADEVAEREVGARVPGARDEHLLPLLRLAHVERRGREIDDELRAGESEIGCRRPRLPEVLADGGRNVDLAQADEQEIASLGEVAVLVEDAVVREEVLAVDRLHAPVRAYRARVGQIAVEPRRADECDDAGRRARDLRQRLVGGADEAWTEEEILRGVARDGELGIDDEISACVVRVCEPAEDLLPISGQIADDRVDLRQRKSQGFRLTVTNLV